VSFVIWSSFTQFRRSPTRRQGGATAKLRSCVIATRCSPRGGDSLCAVTSALPKATKSRHRHAGTRIASALMERWRRSDCTWGVFLFIRSPLLEGSIRYLARDAECRTAAARKDQRARLRRAA
jgi:hypothetical protein